MHRLLRSIAVGFLLAFALGVGAPNQASAQCMENCENPNLIDHHIGPVGCGGCQLFRVYYYYVETWEYSCTNGGTCTVTEEYESPCDVCPW